MDNAIFEALADPTRRRIIELLAAGDLTAGQIADNFAVSRPAVSRHLRVLRGAGLVRAREEAQRRVYHLDAGSLDAAIAWLDRHRAFRTGRLDSPGTGPAEPGNPAPPDVATVGPPPDVVTVGPPPDVATGNPAPPDVATVGVPRRHAALPATPATPPPVQPPSPGAPHDRDDLAVVVVDNAD